jgi:hypothetical protein
MFAMLGKLFSRKARRGAEGEEAQAGLLWPSHPGVR